MADEIDLNFVGGQIKRIRADVRDLKARTARTDADVLALSDALSERLDTLERRVDSGFEVVDNSFETSTAASSGWMVSSQSFAPISARCGAR